MTVRPQLMAVVEDAASRDAIQNAVGPVPLERVSIEIGTFDAACVRLQTAARPDVLVVDVGACGDVAAAMDHLADLCEPGTRVIAIGSHNDIDLYRRLIAFGVTEYLVKPLSPELLGQALRRSLARTGEGPGAPPRRAAALVGARGGVGATCLAVSASVVMAQDLQVRTVLLDLDLHFGSAAMSLDLEPGRGLGELLANPERIDTLLVASAMVTEGERLGILAAEEPLHHDPAVSGEGLAPLLQALGAEAEAVVIDVGRRLDALGRAALAAADVIGLVTDLTLPALRDVQRLLDLLSALNGDGQVLLAANRVGGGAGEIARREFERGIGRPFDFAIPFDPKGAAAAAGQGKSLASVSRLEPVAAELRRLAAALAASPQQTAAKPSWVRRLLRG